MLPKIVVVASVLSALGALANADGIYTKNSPVLQVTSKDFTSLIEQSNHTSMVEFYAPWCGHCQNLKPAYEKAAKNLAGLAKVAAVNCDEESNKPLCTRMGVQGFPTLKIVKPGSKKGKPIIEDYQGPRSAKAIVDALTDKIPNHVKKIQDSDLNAWLTEGDQAKAILFTEKGTTGPLIKALGIDFLGTINFAQIRSKETAAADKFGIKDFPTILLIPGHDQEHIVYKGDMKKDPLVKFFSQIAPPNPDPAPKKVKGSLPKKAKDTASSATASSKFSKASEAHKSSDFDEYMQAQTIILDDDTPTESPLPIVEHEEKPMIIKESAPALPELSTAAELESACLSPKSGNCVLIFLPAEASTDAAVPSTAAEALLSFAEVAEKHHKRKTNIFPFFAIPVENEAGKAIKKDLSLQENHEVDIIAINMKRKWWRPYSASGFDIAEAESFVDAIRLGEGSKKKLPAGFYSVQEAEAIPPEPQAESEPVVEDLSTQESAEAAPEPASTAQVPTHNEL